MGVVPGTEGTRYDDCTMERGDLEYKRRNKTWKINCFYLVNCWLIGMVFGLLVFWDLEPLAWGLCLTAAILLVLLIVGQKAWVCWRSREREGWEVREEREGGYVGGY